MPSKRSHGEGTLRHRSDGRWELRMMDGYQKDGSPRFKTFYGKTQKEVKLKLKEYQDALISGVQLDTILYFEDGQIHGSRVTRIISLPRHRKATNTA